MRVTFNIIRDGLPSIEAASSELARAQQQVASGQRLRAPSDDPVATRQAIGEHAQMAGLDAYTRTANSAASRLTAVDSAMSDIIDKLTNALATTTGARGNTPDQASRNAAAETLRGLREAILGDINGSFQGTSLFAGSRVDVAPYANVGGAWTYQGDPSVVQVEVERGRLATVAYNGQAILQGNDPTDILTVLDGLITAVQIGDQNTMANGVTSLERAFDRVTQAQGRLGADERNIDESVARLSRLRIAGKTRLSKEEDTDMAEAITRMNAADTAYRAALSAVSTAERQSLLDYLR